ncbi:EcsC family protein [Agrilactobacillus fermenti]|uniref:EcsC family protein n=1 Tax=Agrilactobacillus fermenti TaxID=2586909 RepID=UPI001E285DBC|nr:EcsC family protein [Agrilactobacillus fermenti]MCD2256147.1 EcsC family protein [Agrilactobacillus fermenti]
MITIKISQDVFNKSLQYGFEKAMQGTTGRKVNAKSIHQLTTKYMAQYHDPEKAIKALVNQSRLLTATTGAVTNFGGLLTIPVSLPTELVTTLFVNIRVIGSIAYLRGYELTDPKVRALMLAALAGNSGIDHFKQALIKSSTRYLQGRLNQAFFDKVTAQLSHFLFKQFSINAATATVKIIPVVSAAIGGVTEAISTTAVAKAADAVFKPEGLQFGDRLISRQELLTEQTKNQD